METRSRIAAGIVIAAVAIVLVIRSGDAPLTDPDEARLARSSVEMMASGQLVVPTFDGVPRPTRPPLYHWAQAAFFRWFGVNELSARMPSILATAAALILTAFVARRRFGEEGAAWAAAFFGSMPIVVIDGKLGTLEALFAVHVFAAVALDIAEPGESGSSRAAAIGALAGLAFLVKGPVGIVLPLLLILAGRTASGREVWPKAKSALSAATAFAVVVLPWALVYLKQVGLDQAAGIVRREAFERYFATGPDPEAPWFYAKIVLAGFFPWAAPLAVGLVRLLGRRRDPASRTGLYAGAGLLVGLLFLSLGQGKLADYILPLAPLAALVLTWELGQELAAPKERRLGTYLLLLTLAASTLFLAWGASEFGEPALRKVALVAAIAEGLALVVSLVGLALQSYRWVYAAAALATFVVTAAASAWAYPALARERSAMALIEQVGPALSSRPVVALGPVPPSLSFYLDEPIERSSADAVSALAARPDRPILVVSERDLVLLDPTDMAQFREIGKGGGLRAYEPASLDAPGARR